MNPFMLDRNKLINLFFCVVVVVVFFLQYTTNYCSRNDSQYELNHFN